MDEVNCEKERVPESMLKTIRQRVRSHLRKAKSAKLLGGK